MVFIRGKGDGGGREGGGARFEGTAPAPPPSVFVPYLFFKCSEKGLYNDANRLTSKLFKYFHAK